MFDRKLRRMRQLVRASEYVITAHAGEEMELIEGQTLAGEKAIVLAKLGPTGKLVIMTTYLL